MERACTKLGMDTDVYEGAHLPATGLLEGRLCDDLR